MDDTTWERIRYVCDPRRILRDVADEAGLSWYDKGSPEPRASGLFDDIDNRQWASTFKRLIDGSEGVMIRKHPVDLERGPIFPQLRPKDRVEVWEPDVHDHDGIFHTAGGCVCGRQHRYDWLEDPYTNSEREAHEASKRHKYAGVRVDGAHKHPRDPKYMLAPSPKQTVSKPHRHSERTHPGHMHKDHDGYPWYAIRGWHLLTRRKKDRSKKREMRLDLNPVAARMLDAAPIAYFSIEGTLKALAVTSEGAPAFAVPSVTMWPARELHVFAGERLRGKTAVVLPDSDWRSNPMVALQAFSCAEYLDDIPGLSAIVAAATNSDDPAPCDGHGIPRRDCRECRKRGVDDHLADGLGLEDLMVVDRQVPPAFDRWRDRIMLARSIGDIRHRERLVDVVEWMVLHADDQGEVARPGKTLARHMRMSLDRIKACVASVEDLPEPDPWDPRTWTEDAATVWDDYRPFTVSLVEADKSRYATSDWFYRVFTIRPDLWATDRQQPLGDVLADRWAPSTDR